MSGIIRSRISLADIILIVVLALVTIVSAFYFFRKTDNSVVRVYKNNILIGDYPLGEDRDLVIDSHNRLRIQNHKVRMTMADCPDKRCVKQGPSDMFPIICLPNRVVVEIVNAKGKKQFLLY